MIEQTGQVSRVKDGRAWITCRPATCRACMEGRGCGAGIFAVLLDRRESSVCVSDDGRALRPGDLVVLGLDERRLLDAAAQLYGLPLAGLIAGALAGAALGGAANDWAVLGGAVVGLGAVLFRQRRREDPYPRPVVLRRADAPGRGVRETESLHGKSQARV